MPRWRRIRCDDMDPHLQGFSYVCLPRWLPVPMIVISATATFSSWNAMPAGTMWGKTSPGTAAKSRRTLFVGQKAFVFPLVRSPDSYLPSRSVQGDFHPDSYGLHLCGEFHHDDQDKELGGQEAEQDAVVTLIVRESMHPYRGTVLRVSRSGSQCQQSLK